MTGVIHGSKHETDTSKTVQKQCRDPSWPSNDSALMVEAT